MSLQPGPSHAGAHPFDNQVTFQLGNGADDDDNGAAERPACVDVLAEAYELDVEVAQFVEYFQEVADRSGQAVKSPQTRTISKRLRRASASI